MRVISRCNVATILPSPRLPVLTEAGEPKKMEQIAFQAAILALPFLRGSVSDTVTYRDRDAFARGCSLYKVEFRPA